MAYYSGVANDMTAVRQALIDACVGEGWSWSSSNEVLHKNSAFIRLVQTGNYLRINGRTSLLSGDTSRTIQIGAFSVRRDIMVFPIGYEIFVFDLEESCE